MSSTTNNNTVYTENSLIGLLNSEPSICIPRLFMNITEERVMNVFADLFGDRAIDRIDMIERKNKNGESYKRAFVHFNYWPRREQATEVRLKLLNGDEVKIVYDEPWFWRISASRSSRPEERALAEPVAIAETKRPFIILDAKDAADRRPRPSQPMPRYEERRDERSQRPSYEKHDQRPSYEKRDQRPSYEKRDQRPSYEKRDQRPSYEQRDQRPSYEQRDQRPRAPRNAAPRHATSQDYSSRIETNRPPKIHVTPTKEPEIAAWIERVPGAPVKGKKPRLVLDEATAPTISDEMDDIINRARSLKFDDEEDTTTKKTETETTETETKTETKTAE
jgi:hypothetical protein